MDGKTAHNGTDVFNRSALWQAVIPLSIKSDMSLTEKTAAAAAGKGTPSGYGISSTGSHSRVTTTKIIKLFNMIWT